MRGALCTAIAILAVACASGTPAPAPAADPESLAFSERIESFYGALRGRPLDAFATYDDPKLRGYFAGPDEFSDWYAAVANRVRASNLRFGSPAEVRIRAFRFAGRDTATVDVVLAGPDKRPLRLGQVEVERTDVWRRSEGIWLLTPDRL